MHQKQPPAKMAFSRAGAAISCALTLAPVNDSAAATAQKRSSRFTIGKGGRSVVYFSGRIGGITPLTRGIICPRETLTNMNVKTIALLTVVLLPSLGSVSAQQVSTVAGKSATKRAVFAQSCFWTGEMKLGQIEGVVRTEAGFFKGREVTLVDYAPERVALEDLARQAKQAGVADTVYVEASAQRSLGGVSVGAPLDGTYRPAPAGDQKKQIEGTPFARLQLSAEQATKVNAFAREDQSKALAWLNPNQREQIKGAK